MIPPKSTVALLSLHLSVEPKSKVVQFPEGNFFFAAPALIPAEFQVPTAMIAANQKI